MPHGSDPAELARIDGRRLDFAAVYRAHFDYVWTCLRRFGVAESALEDAAQEVFVVVHRRLGEFAGRAAVRTWLFAIARRIAFRFRRSAQRTARRHDALAHRAIEPAPLELDDAIRDAQARQRLAAFLAELDDDKRDAFLLGELEGLGREELGRTLGINPNTAYARLRAARLQFHREFANPDARAAALACGRTVEPAPAARRNRVWLLLGLDLDLDAAPAAAAPASAALAGGLKLLVAAGALSVLTFMVQRTGPFGHAQLVPAAPAVGAREPGAVAADPRSPDAASRSAIEPAATSTAASTAPPTRTSAPTAAPRGSPRLGATSRQPAASDDTALGGRSSPATSGESQQHDPARESGGAAAPPPLQRPTRAPPSQSAPAMAPPRELGPGDTPTATDAPLAADVRLLGQARRALADGQPAAALTHLEEHAERFPASPLRAARQAMRISVLCRLGHLVAAEREATRFLLAHPDSALADQVREGCPEPVTNPATGGD